VTRFDVLPGRRACPPSVLARWARSNGHEGHPAGPRRAAARALL